MKKSELTQLTQVIEHLVAREVRKQLPVLIAEIQRNQSAKPLIAEAATVPDEPLLNEEATPEDFKASLRELFAGATPTHPAAAPAPVMRHYTKDPVLNQILNETKGDLRSREGVGGMAAVLAGYNRSPVLAEMPSEGDMSSIISQSEAVVLREGQESTHAPLAAIPQGVSVLDVARQVPDKSVAAALTKNYSALMKAVDNKRQNKAFGT
jgi:hypothetical protein